MSIFVEVFCSIFSLKLIPRMLSLAIGTVIEVSSNWYENLEKENVTDLK